MLALAPESPADHRGPQLLNLSAATTDRATRIALIFALLAERLSTFYAHGQWLSEAQGATLAADWLSRSKRRLELAERRHLSALSDQLARQVAASVSREAGLYIAHELTEALDPRYQSDVAQSMMQACERLLDEGEV